MKLNWGTGIFIFLALFILASVAFIIFAVNQDVNLVHKDYYEKGTDFTRQMEVKARSERYMSLISINQDKDSVKIIFPDELAGRIDSGYVVFYRPSDMHNDLNFRLQPGCNSFSAAKDQMISGRYIIRLNWYSDRYDYEVNKETIINANN